MTSLLLTMCLAPVLSINSLQAATNTQCTKIEINQVYQQNQSAVENPPALSEIYDQQVVTLNNFAEDHNLTDFDVIAGAANLSPTNESPDKSEMIIAVTFKRNDDPQIFDKLYTALNPLNFSYSSLISTNYVCEI